MNTLTKSITLVALAAAAALAHADDRTYPGENSMSRFTGEFPSAPPAAHGVVKHGPIALDAAPYGDNSLNRRNGESAAMFDAAAQASRDDPRRAMASSRDARQRVPLENLAHTRKRTDPFLAAGS